MKSLGFFYIWLFLAWNTVSAKNLLPCNDFMEFQFHFSFDNDQFNLNYMDNLKTYSKFNHYVDSLGLEKIDSIVVITTSSPEGNLKYNASLSQKRSESIYRFLVAHYQSLASKMIVRKEDEAWRQIKNFILQDDVILRNDKEKALSIIDADLPLSERKIQLSQLPSYTYLKDKYYKRSRNSLVTVYIKVVKEVAPVEKQPEVKPLLPNLSLASSRDSRILLKYFKQGEPKKTLFTVKTNLLYDAITAVNFAVEVPIGERWSVELEDVCPWWHHENKWAFQLLQVGAEGRYWFRPSGGRDVLTGQFGGIYAMGGKYDLQNRRDICYQGEFWSVGASYGYAMPISKHFNMEFSISLGFMSTHYKHYNPAAEWENLVADKRKRGIFNYFGPTKLKISLIYPINVKIKKKGGRHD